MMLLAVCAHGHLLRKERVNKRARAKKKVRKQNNNDEIVGEKGNSDLLFFFFFLCFFLNPYFYFYFFVSVPCLLFALCLYAVTLIHFKRHFRSRELLSLHALVLLLMFFWVIGVRKEGWVVWMGWSKNGTGGTNYFCQKPSQKDDILSFRGEDGRTQFWENSKTKIKNRLKDW